MEKKVAWRTVFGRFEVTVQRYLIDGHLRIPFSERGQVKSLECSTPLQRRIVDFGADVSFEQAAHKLREHYNIEVPVTQIRRVVLKHARKASDLQIQQLKRAAE